METIKHELSKSVTSEVLARFKDDKILVCVPTMWDNVAEDLLELIKGTRIDLTYFYPTLDTAQNTRRFLALLKKEGIVAERIRNVRTVTYAHAYRFVKDPNFFFIGLNDYEKLDIEPDKEETIKDHQRKRRRHAWP